MTESTSTRPLSTAHLVFGVLFVGIAAVKFIGEATHADLPKSAIGFPIVLIGAGLIGLVATFLNARRRQPVAAFAAEEPTEVLGTRDDDDETTVIEEDR